jgi:hypothetical protein
MRDVNVRWILNGWFWWVVAAVGTAAAWALGEWTPMQSVVLAGIALLGTWRSTRPTAWFLAPIVGWLVGYRWMSLWSEWAHQQVSITPVAEMDAWLTSWFVTHGGTFQKTLMALQSTWLDLFGAILYLTHTAGIFGFVVWRLYRQIRQRHGVPSVRDLTFTWGFLVLNMLAFSVWIVWPVAPPWYLDSFGATVPTGTVTGDPAGIARVDAWLNVELFGTIYGSNEFVFGAMPSLHVGYPAWFVMFLRKPSARGIGVVYVLAMAFFAVYFNHHYLVDVLAGVGLAAGCRLVAWRIERRWDESLSFWRPDGGRT